MNCIIKFQVIFPPDIPANIYSSETLFLASSQKPLDPARLFINPASFYLLRNVADTEGATPSGVVSGFFNVLTYLLFYKLKYSALMLNINTLKTYHIVICFSS